MDDVEKLNIDSIIARLLEGNFYLLHVMSDDEKNCNSNESCLIECIQDYKWV